MTAEMTRARTQQPAQGHGGGKATRSRPLFRPLVDIYETEQSLFVVADMPGVSADDLDITLEGRTLSIHGRRPDVAPEGYRQVYTEYADGDYQRSFTLSEDIDQSRISASQENGLLILELPKAEPAKARKIEVKTH